MDSLKFFSLLRCKNIFDNHLSPNLAIEEPRNFCLVLTVSLQVSQERFNTFYQLTLSGTLGPFKKITSLKRFL